MNDGFDDASRQRIVDVASRHGFDAEAGIVMARSILSGGGNMAQFSHPSLGGMGQWSQGGMLMIGDMFNNQLKYRVSALASDLAEAYRNGSITEVRAYHTGALTGGSSQGFGANWWPAELGFPSSSGSQNDRRYAIFPDKQRLAIETGGRVTVYDTGRHWITGVSQQQGNDGRLGFSSQFGTVAADDFQEIRAEFADGASRPKTEFETADGSPPDSSSAGGWSAVPLPQSTPSEIGPSSIPAAASTGTTSAEEHPKVASSGFGGQSDIIETIRKLAALKDAGILSDEEFGAKKTELLARL